MMGAVCNRIGGGHKLGSMTCPRCHHPAGQTPFGDGYRRDEEMAIRLDMAFMKALEANPTLRLGQIIFRAMGGHDSVDLLPHIHDEQLLAGLIKMAGDD
jgi:hypothetical protein